MYSPKKTIEKIRKIRFQIGLDTSNLSSDQIDALRDKNKVLEDAASLAKEINTKKPHFILELIQNAEDNYYEDKVTPRVKFTIRRNDLIIKNNERGFREENVWALCGIGQTTKKNRSLGYIGEKGIGFKSVFMISDDPQIYSKGFHFKFKYEKENPVSILIPHWVGEVPSYVDRSETNIVLPIRNKGENEIDEYVNQIHPTLLLFLRKLKVIQVENKILRKSEKIERYDSNGVIEIRHGTKKSYWRIIRKLVTVPRSIDEERRKGIHETEIVLAFPLTNDGSARTAEKQHIFAFLPIRKYGFRFIIQADFLLAIGREDIIKDNYWNKWLRDSLVSVFLEAIEQFKVDRKLKHTFYNYIPVEDDVEDVFFSQVVEQTYKKLQNTECLLTESNQWKKPSDILMAENDLRKLVTNEDLQIFFNKEYLSKRVKATKNILQRLKVDEFLVDRLLECLKNHDWIEKQDSKWFARLFYYLSRQELTDEQIDLLKELGIVKLENGELTSTNEGPIFLPLSKRGRDYGFEPELRVVARNVIELVKKLEKKDKISRIKDFLGNLGIRSPHPFEIIENHILPVYEDNIWRRKDSNTLLGYVRYIKDHLEEYKEESGKRLNAKKQLWEKKEDPLKKLKESLLIRIKRSEKKEYKHLDNVYLSKIYGNKNDLETLFNGIEVDFLHPCYIEDILKSDKLRKDKISKWRTFFLNLGVSDLLIVKKDDKTEYDEGANYADNKVTKKHIQKWDKEETIWKDCEWKDTDWRGYYIHNDWKSEDFKNFVQKVKRLHKDVRMSLCKKLISQLDENWSKYKKTTSCRYYYRSSGQQGWWRAETPSTFLLTMHKNTWCPTTENILKKPSQIFLNKPDIKEVLGDSVSYLALEIKDEDFVKTLGLNTEANADGVLNYLKTTVEQGGLDKNRLKKIYSFLNKHFEDDEDGIREAFSNYPLIYIPNTAKKFFTSQDVLWKDLSDIFGENRAYLEKHYPKLQYFFVEKLRIIEKPSPKDYADVLVDLSKKEQITDRDKRLVLKIYKELDYHLNPKNVDKPISEEDWWHEFARKPIFLTEKKEPWRSDKNVFINDDRELCELFGNEEDVAFLWLPKGYHPDRIRFLIDATEIRYLSNAVEKTPIFDEASCSEHEDLTNQIKDLMPYIIRYLYWKENPKYEELKSNGFFNNIKNLMVYAVDKLKVNYTINISLWNSVNTIADHRCILHQNRLYISSEFGNTDYVAIELSKIFGGIKGLDSFVISIFEKQFQEKIEELLAVMGIEVLPKPDAGVLVELPSQKIRKKILEVPRKEVVEQPARAPTFPQEYKPRLIEPEQPSDLIKSRITEEWAPECSPKEADISSEEFSPKDAPQRLIIKTIEGRTHGPLAGKPSTPSKEIREQDVLDEKSKIEIGKYGEEIALLSLREEKTSQYPDATIKDTEDGFILEKDDKALVKALWLNKNVDIGRGHDIELLENDVMCYIEVKSTKTKGKDWFDISRAQWAFMHEKGGNFCIYRVYGAGSRNPRVVRICNPAKLWQEGRISAYPVRVQL